MKILNRKQFSDMWEEKQSGLGKDDSPLWEMERYYNRKCRSFVSVHPIGEESEYWVWCYKNCAGTILCYSSSDEEQWWGFTHKPDIFLWMLRWA